MNSNKRTNIPAPRAVELLAPARDVSTAVCAITHGADAVYIGPEGFGARSAASNSTEEIRRLCEFAHPYRARVYATVNTLVKDSELKAVERLIHDLYRAGVDALIVQDMGILRLDLPDIVLHASTQCDTRTPEKARFLQEAGFSQIVLARELTLPQIKEITEAVEVPVETFVHGALCVSYSGRCHASWTMCGRSANRGRCAQVCRLPFTLRDADGRTLHREAHLLSLRDFNSSAQLEELLAAGVSSFKIEGRLKDAGYVKNITAYYRQLIDKQIAQHPELYRRASFGDVELRFTPDPVKSFNRGFTHYFLTERRPAVSMASLGTPKSLGEPVTAATELHAGDGVSFFTSRGEYTGVRVNKVVDGKPVYARRVDIPRGAQLYRTTDAAFEVQLERADSAERKIAVDIELYENRAVISDERGCRAVVPVPEHGSDARKPMEPRRFFDKLGGTCYRLRSLVNHLKPESFIPASQLTAVRRQLNEALDTAAAATYPHASRRQENMEATYPERHLVYADNVANARAEVFYREHGVESIEPALETAGDYRDVKSGTVVMTTRYCMLRELGMCKRSRAANGQPPLREPLSITNAGGASFRLRFNCKDCEMQLLKP